MIPPFTFEKKEGKWTSKVHIPFVMYWHQTHGLPIESVVDRMNTWPLEQRMNLKLESWKVFAEENKLDLDEIRANNNKNREAFVEAYESLNFKSL